MPFRRANTLTAVRTARMMLHARKRRKIPRQRHPDNVALGYFGALVEILKHAREAVERHVLPELDALVRASDSLRHDADTPSERLRKSMQAAAEAFDRNYQNQERAYASLARGTAERVSAFNRGELGKQIQAVIGVDLPINDPKLDLRIQEFTAENVAKISDLAPQYLKDVENTISKGMRSGARPEDIRTALEDRYGVAESRAKFIARDQVGKFNGALSQARQKAVGVEGYTWRTMNDNRVRDEHVPREGKPYKWSDPPEGGHPGEDYQCRCYPEPDFSQILADLA